MQLNIESVTTVSAPSQHGALPEGNDQHNDPKKFLSAGQHRHILSGVEEWKLPNQRQNTELFG